MWVSESDSPWQGEAFAGIKIGNIKDTEPANSNVQGNGRITLRSNAAKSERSPVNLQRLNSKDNPRQIIVGKIRSIIKRNALKSNILTWKHNSLA